MKSELKIKKGSWLREVLDEANDRYNSLPKWLKDLYEQQRKWDEFQQNEKLKNKINNFERL